MLVVKNPLAIAGDIRDAGSVPGLGRSPGGGHGNPIQYSCLENPMDRGAWRATAHRVTKSRTRLKLLSAHARTHTHTHTRIFVCTNIIIRVTTGLWTFLVAQMVKNLPAMQETQVWSLGWEDPLEKGMTTHSCILAWRIPWTVASGGFCPWGRRRSD